MNEQALRFAGVYPIDSAVDPIETRSLSPGQAARITKALGKTIFCSSGRLWATVANEGTDHLLTRGESLTVSAPGSLVIQGLPSCSFRLS
jgi:hypothetical protein